MSTVAGILFDLDGTLLEEQSIVPSPAARFARARGLALSDVEAEHTWLALLDRHWDDFVRGVTHEAEFRRAPLRELDPTLRDATDADVDHAFDLLTSCYAPSWGLYDDALPALHAALEAGYAVGLLTNGETSHQRAKITTLGLDALPITVTISGTVGAHKPAAAVFEHACASLNVEPERTLMVGDNAPNDVDGALAAGLRAVWLNRATDERHPQAPTIRTLATLLDHARI